MQEKYNYYIKYKLFSEEDYTEFKFEGSYEDLKDTIFQLGRGVVRFDGILFKGLQVFQDIQISEQNYDFKSNGKHYEIMEFSSEEIAQAGTDPTGFFACLEDEMNMSGYKKDVTNQLLIAGNITIDSLGGKKGIRLEDNKIYVNGIPFDIDKNTKLYELLDIILRVRYYNQDESVSYDKVLEYFMNNLYNELKKEDLTQVRIKDILKSKLENIRDTLGLKELPISAQKGGIVFRI